MDTTNPATLLSKRYRQEDIPDLTGRIAVVTGGSAGIGYHTALQLARANARVIIISSQQDKGEAAVKEMNDNIKTGGSVEFRQANFADLKATDALAKQLSGDLERLDILVLNAGIGQAPYGLTGDGLERHFEVNNLAAYVLALRLLPLMEKTVARADTAPLSVRIVLQSSEMHRVAPSDTQFASKDEINKERDGTQLYGRTKLGLILLGRELAERKLATSGSGPPAVLVLSVHPGTVDTEVQTAWTESYGAVFGKTLEVLTRLVGKSAPEGAEAGVWAATTKEINDSNWKQYQAQYFDQARGKPEGESKQAKDGQLAQNFWNLCAGLTQEILGEKLE